MKSLYQGDAMQYSYGLSIYFPLHEVAPSYERLDFARDTRWVTFLKEYLTRIRRPHREFTTRGAYVLTVDVENNSGCVTLGVDLEGQFIVIEPGEELGVGFCKRLLFWSTVLL